MNIAVIAADLIPGKLGGAETHAVEVIKSLSHRHRILLFVGEDTSIKKLFSANVTVRPVKYPKIPNFYGLSYILFGYRQIKAALDGENFDLIWAKQCFPQAPLGSLLKSRFKKPLYITAQNPMLHREELVVKGSLLKPFAGLLASLLTPLISRSLQNADLVACVSGYSQKLALKMGARKTIVIPNGVDLQKFGTNKTTRSKTLRIVSTSSLIPRNGLDTLIRAVALLPKDITWSLRIAGEGPQKNKLEELIKQLQLENKVKLVGRINNSAIPEFLASGNLFIRPSRREGFGVSFLEAMAAGLPVIATPVGGITDFLKDGQTGLLVKPDQPLKLAKAILKIKNNSRITKQMVTNALNLTSSRYSWDNIAYEVEKQFLRLV